MFFLKSIFAYWFFKYLKFRYAIKIATTSEEKEKIFKFRYQIYRTELQHTFLDKMTTTEGMLCDEYDDIANSMILYSGDIDNIQGTVRFSVWTKNSLPKQLSDKYFLTENMLNNLNSIGEIRFLQISKKYRKSLLLYTLLGYLYELYCKQPHFDPDVYFHDCQPGLIVNYIRFGSYNYTNKMIFKELGILQIPLAYNPFDFKQLSKSKSLLCSLARYYCYKYKKQVSADIYSYKARDFSTFLPHINLHVTTTMLAQYQKNILTSDLQTLFLDITKISNKWLVLSVSHDTPIITQGILDYDMFLLLEGKLGVYTNEICFATLEPGHIFGEMALLGAKHIRYTSVVSLTDVKVLLIPRNFLHMLEKHNLKSANQFLHILCNSLILKLLATNAVLQKKLTD